MRIGVGSDHLGVVLKASLPSHLRERGEPVQDFGAMTDEPVDYPDIAAVVCEALLDGEIERAVLICGTGLGMAIAANKHAGVYAASATDPYTARAAQQSNGAQVLTLGANVVGPGLACEIIDAWLDAHFQGGRSSRKLAKIRRIEQGQRHGPQPREPRRAVTGGRPV
jgi:ribose 5-phosphate isomerase B